MTLNFLAKALAATPSEDERVLILEEFRSRVVSLCIKAVGEVTEPEGPMPPENIKVQNENPELAVRATIRLTKQEAVENIMKINWEMARDS